MRVDVAAGIREAVVKVIGVVRFEIGVLEEVDAHLGSGLLRDRAVVVAERVGGVVVRKVRAERELADGRLVACQMHSYPGRQRVRVVELFSDIRGPAAVSDAGRAVQNRLQRLERSREVPVGLNRSRAVHVDRRRQRRAFRRDVASVLLERGILGEKTLAGGDVAHGQVGRQVESHRARALRVGMVVAERDRVGVALSETGGSACEAQSVARVQLGTELLDRGLPDRAAVIEVQIAGLSDRIVERQRWLQAAERASVVVRFGEGLVPVLPGRLVAHAHEQVASLTVSVESEFGGLSRVVARVVVGRGRVDQSGEAVDGHPLRVAVVDRNAVAGRYRAFFAQRLRVAEVSSQRPAPSAGTRLQKGPVVVGRERVDPPARCVVATRGALGVYVDHSLRIVFERVGPDQPAGQVATLLAVALRRADAVGRFAVELVAGSPIAVREVVGVLDTGREDEVVVLRVIAQIEIGRVLPAEARGSGRVGVAARQVGFRREIDLLRDPLRFRPLVGEAVVSRQGQMLAVAVRQAGAERRAAAVSVSAARV